MSGPDSVDWITLSDDQYRSYEQNGYLHLKQAFTQQEVQRGLDIVEAVGAADVQSAPAHASFKIRSHTVRVRDAISRHRDLAYFIEHPALLGPLISILGLNLHVLGTEVFIRSISDVPLAYWHTDGGAALQRTLLAGGSQGLQLKAQIFLTDVTEDHCGNFLLIPGSHHKLPSETLATCTIEELNGPLDRDELPANAVVIRAKPGDVIIFPYGLWHAVAKNQVRTRNTLLFRYGQLWHRPHDYLSQPDSVLQHLSPRLRRMFGDMGSNPHPTDYYKPQDQFEIMARSGKNKISSNGC